MMRQLAKNRVIPSGRMASRAGLSVILLLALATMAVLDAARARNRSVRLTLWRLDLTKTIVRSTRLR